MDQSTSALEPRKEELALSTSFLHDRGFLLSSISATKDPEQLATLLTQALAKFQKSSASASEATDGDEEQDEDEEEDEETVDLSSP